MENKLNTTTRDVVQRYLRVLADRDLEIIKLFSNEVDWYIPGNQTIAPWVGKRSSKQEVMEFYQLLWENTKPLDAEVELLMIQENHAVVTGAFTTYMLASGGVFKSLFSIQMTIEQGVIVKYRLLEDSNELVMVLSGRDQISEN